MPLFTYHSTGGHLKLTKVKFLTMMKLNMGRTAWLPTYNGTLFSYGTTEFLVADVLPDVVKAMPAGGWSSDSFHRYRLHPPSYYMYSKYIFIIYVFYFIHSFHLWILLF
jgi:hypothetical protein